MSRREMTAPRLRLHRLRNRNRTRQMNQILTTTPAPAPAAAVASRSCWIWTGTALSSWRWRTRRRSTTSTATATGSGWRGRLRMTGSWPMTRTATGAISAHDELVLRLLCGGRTDGPRGSGAFRHERQRGARFRGMRSGASSASGRTSTRMGRATRASCARWTEAGITSLSLTSDGVEQTVAGNTVFGEGSYTDGDGSQSFFDVALQHSAGMRFRRGRRCIRSGVLERRGRRVSRQNRSPRRHGRCPCRRRTALPPIAGLRR